MADSFRIVSGDEGARLDVFLSEQLHLTRSKVREMVNLGCVRVNGVLPKPSLRVKRSTVIEGEIPQERPLTAQPEEIPLTVLYEDEYLIAVDKPAGMVVHPSAGHPAGTLVNALLGHLGREAGAPRMGGWEDGRMGEDRIPDAGYRMPDTGCPMQDTGDRRQEAGEQGLHTLSPLLQQLNTSTIEQSSPPADPQSAICNPQSSSIRPGIVHRLDKGTTGVILMAKDPVTQEMLSRLFKDRAMKKTYRAIVEGAVTLASGTVEGNIGRHPVERKKMAVVKTKGRSAVTDYRVVERLNGFTGIEAFPVTGRTHQIRVHLAHIGHAVVGDETYGRKARKLTPRPLLHAMRLVFRHPRTGRDIVIEAPLPRDMEDFARDHEIHR